MKALGLPHRGGSNWPLSSSSSTAHRDRTALGIACEAGVGRAKSQGQMVNQGRWDRRKSHHLNRRSNRTMTVSRHCGSAQATSRSPRPLGLLGSLECQISRGASSVQNFGEDERSRSLKRRVTPECGQSLFCFEDQIFPETCLGRIWVFTSRFLPLISFCAGSGGTGDS